MFREERWFSKCWFTSCSSTWCHC